MTWPWVRHFRIPYTYVTSLCGVRNVRHETVDPSRVTCLRCRRSLAIGRRYFDPFKGECLVRWPRLGLPRENA